MNLKCKAIELYTNNYFNKRNVLYASMRLFYLLCFHKINYVNDMKTVMVRIYIPHVEKEMFVLHLCAATILPY